MSYLFKFPDIGEGLEEGKILEWYVEVGQAVKAGDLLVNMETDKVAADIPSPKSGIITKLFGAVGDIIHVGSPLVAIALESREAGVASAEGEEDTAGVVGTLEMADANAVLAASDEITNGSADAGSVRGKAFATPHVRAIAKELGIDIQQIKGTGPGGRVTKEDLERSMTTISPVQKSVYVQSLLPEDVTIEPLTQIRKAIARNMMISKQNAAHVSVFEEVEISELMTIRENYKVKYAERNVKLTYLPFVVKATVLALQQHRNLNAQIDMEGGRMIYKNRYNIGIAMDTPEGLVVPVIKDADRLSLFELSRQITEFAVKARERKLTLDDMKEGTFTISNFGSISGIFGTPVINYPQAAILGIGRVVQQPVVKHQQIVIGNVLGLSLTVDHRIVDGGDTARFLKQVIDHLADPISLLME